MTKCEELAVNLSPQARQIWNSLSEAAGESKMIDKNGVVWLSVYLDNGRPQGMSPRSFAGYLSALTKAGLYYADNAGDESDNFFGYCRTDETEGR